MYNEFITNLKICTIEIVKIKIIENGSPLKAGIGPTRSCTVWPPGTPSPAIQTQGRQKTARPKCRYHHTQKGTYTPGRAPHPTAASNGSQPLWSVCALARVPLWSWPLWSVCALARAPPRSRPLWSVCTPGRAPLRSRPLWSGCALVHVRSGPRFALASWDPQP